MTDLDKTIENIEQGNAWEESDEIGLSEVKDSLMKLEIWGRIDVTTEADNRRITLREE